jgi:hypothetical protein
MVCRRVSLPDNIIAEHIRAVDCHNKLGPTVWAKQELDLIRKLQLVQSQQRKGDISGCTVLYYIYL